MIPGRFIRNLQNKPYHVRTRILWGTTIIIGFVLILVWLATLKNNVTHLNGKNVLDFNDLTTDLVTNQQTKSQYISVERAETTENGSFQIFFKVNNSTLDILNFSSVEQVKLKADQASFNPLSINDRQSKPFVQKILSKTENYGVLIFQEINAATGTLIFDELYFEQEPAIIFKETLELDFKSLNKTQEIRN